MAMCTCCPADPELEAIIAYCEKVDEAYVVEWLLERDVQAPGGAMGLAAEIVRDLFGPVRVDYLIDRIRGQA